jgi:hypothetical protein
MLPSSIWSESPAVSMLVHLRARADDGCGRGSAGRPGRRKDRIHIERFLAGRPSATLAAQIAQLQEKAAGLTIGVTLDGRTARSNSPRKHPRQRARAGPAPFACKAGSARPAGQVTGARSRWLRAPALAGEEIAAGYVLTCQSVPVGKGSRWTMTRDCGRLSVSCAPCWTSRPLTGTNGGAQFFTLRRAERPLLA